MMARTRKGVRASESCIYLSSRLQAAVHIGRKQENCQI